MLQSSTSNTLNCNQMEALFTSLPAIIFIYDLNTMKYVQNNGKFKDILGYNQDDFNDLTVDIGKYLIHPDDKHILKKRITYFKNIKNNSWSGVLRFKHKDGHWLWVYSKVTVIERGLNNQAVKLLGITLNAEDSFMTKELFYDLIREKIRKRNYSKIKNLTRREIEIICLITRGYNYQNIAAKLNIQPDTVNKHRKNILSKLCLKNIASLTSFAKENGLA